MLSTEFEGRKKAEIESIEWLRRAYLLYFIFIILLISLSVASSLSLIMYFMASPSGHIDFSLLGFLIIVISISIAGTLIYLYYLYRGFSKIEKFVGNLDIGKYGIILSIIGMTSSFFGISIFLSPSRYIFSLPPYFLYPMLLLSITGFIGTVLIGIALWRVGKYYRNSLISLGAIFLIFMSFIGAILLYMGFGEVQKRIRNRLPPPPMPPWI